MSKKQSRPNRIIKIPRPLYQLMEEIAYFQEEAISTECFIEEILMEIGRYYGDQIRKTVVENRGDIVGRYLDRTKVLNNPNDNNRFFDGVNI